MTKSSAKIFFLSNHETKPRFLCVFHYLKPQGLITLTEITRWKMNQFKTHQLWTMSFCTASRASLRTLGSLWVIIFITITLHPRFSSTLEIKHVVNQQLQQTMWQAFLVGRRRLGLETIHLFPRITSKICLYLVITIWDKSFPFLRELTTGISFPTFSEKPSNGEMKIG